MRGVWWPEVLAHAAGIVDTYDTYDIYDTGVTLP